MTCKNIFKAFQIFAADETGSNHLLVCWRVLKLNHEETAVFHEETVFVTYLECRKGYRENLVEFQEKV